MVRIPEDLEHLRRRFEGFRNTRVGRSPLPEALWAAPAELAESVIMKITGHRTRGVFERVQHHGPERHAGGRKKWQEPGTYPRVVTNLVTNEGEAKLNVEQTAHPKMLKAAVSIGYTAALEL